MSLRPVLVLAGVLAGCASSEGGSAVLVPTGFAPGGGAAADPSDVPAVVVEPAAPVAGSALRCDVDRPASVSWEVDGEPVEGVGTEVPGDLVDGYQTWTCVAETVRGGVGEASVGVDEACASLRADAAVVAAYAAELDLLDSAWTVEAWVRPDVGAEVPPDVGVHLVVLARGDTLASADEDLDYGLRLDGTGQVELVSGGDGDCAVLEAEADLDGAWHHLAGTYDPLTGAKVLYVDGREAARCTAPRRPRWAYGGASVGSLVDEEGARDAFVGWIDEVRVSSTVRYDGAFTPERYPHADAHTAWLLHFNEQDSFRRSFWFRGTRDQSGAGLHPEIRVDGVVTAETSTCEVPAAR